MATDKIRLGVDIGGTFTDLALEAPGSFYSVKLLTTQDAPEQAILQGINDITASAGIRTSDIDMIIHGTTLATNALIQRNGARTALVTTEGFRDVIEMRTENRFEQYDINLVLPTPLIERQHRFTLHERLDAGGEVLRPLDRDEIHSLVDKLIERKYESIAIGLIHAYANGSHERTVRDEIVARMPGVSVSISSEVAPQMREYERFNTVCANAYVRPKIQAYLERLVDKLKDMGATCPLYLMHSGGGLISVEDAVDFPVRLVESGPAGGAIFAADLARRHGLDKALSFDMGGTTAKICMVSDATPKTANSFEVARSYRFKKGSGMPISVPVIEMVEIGAGGGSIAHLDNMQQIRVGPQSAESDPGPACYDRGGQSPTVTDGDLLLGKLDAKKFAGGTILLSVENAEKAVSEKLGHPLGMDTVNAAFGISEVIDENMANAARMHAVENGEDLGEYALIAFGGAAPLHAARLCEKLGIDTCLVPPGAGVGSAIGFLKAPFSFEAVRSDYQLLSSLDTARICTLVNSLSDEAGRHVSGVSGDTEELIECKAFMRYVGQGWEIPVYLDTGSRLENIKNWDSGHLISEFEKAYRVLFGRTVADLDIEIASWAVRKSLAVPVPGLMDTVEGKGIMETNSSRALFSKTRGKFISAGLYHRNEIAPGRSLPGPAIIGENETTTIIPNGCKCTMLLDGTLKMTFFDKSPGSTESAHD